jgi:creatinine amidohydrolase/Fe(II)-dependent formamide hydrolase-like protein
VFLEFHGERLPVGVDTLLVTGLLEARGLVQECNAADPALTRQEFHVNEIPLSH